MSTSPTGNRTSRTRSNRLRRSRMARRSRLRGRSAQRRGPVTGQARQRLRSFRQASMLAVSLTAFLLLLFPDAGPDAAAQEMPAQEDTLEQTASPPDLQEEDPALRPDELARETTEAFEETIVGLWVGFMSYLPRLLVVLAIFVLAWLVVRLLRIALHRLLRGWQRANAFVALSGIIVWAVTIGIAVSVLAGDIRAMLGSIGLIGLALSWSLQTPIESFTGWLMNSFQGYYRTGDRVAVGDIFGDVYRIDFLTTTVWEIGSPERGGFVRAEQSTGRLITFPNNEVLAGSIVNLTRDFPFVWDEITVPIANESDLPHAKRVLKHLADELLGDYMADPSHRYQNLLQGAGLQADVPDEPQVFVNLGEYSTDLTIRYLVGARERRAWKTHLAEAINKELSKPAHKGRILSVYDRQQLQFVRRDGSAFDPDWAGTTPDASAPPDASDNPPPEEPNRGEA